MKFLKDSFTFHDESGFPKSSLHIWVRSFINIIFIGLIIKFFPYSINLIYLFSFIAIIRVIYLITKTLINKSKV